MSEITMPEAFASAADVTVGDWLCVQRRPDPTEDVWDEVMATFVPSDGRVTLRTRVVGPVTFLDNDRVTVRRAQPEDDLVLVMAYALHRWWARTSSEADDSLGGGGSEPDADDWQMAAFVADYIRDVFTVEVTQPSPSEVVDFIDEEESITEGGPAR